MLIRLEVGKNFQQSNFLFVEVWTFLHLIQFFFFFKHLTSSYLDDIICNAICKFSAIRFIRFKRFNGKWDIYFILFLWQHQKFISGVNKTRQKPGYQDTMFAPTTAAIWQYYKVTKQLPKLTLKNMHIQSLCHFSQIDCLSRSGNGLF